MPTLSTSGPQAVQDQAAEELAHLVGVHGAPGGIPDPAAGDHGGYGVGGQFDIGGPEAPLVYARLDNAMFRTPRLNAVNVARSFAEL